jgi:predicted RNA binding protein YcfA (HicA-like mRNA interferase family)
VSRVAIIFSGTTTETLGPGLLHKILRDCQMTAEELSDLL